MKTDNRKMKSLFISLLFGLFIILAPGIIEAASCKVLVVMSYEESFPWVVEQKDGIDMVLSDRCEVRYFYMNTKVNPAGGHEKAMQAYALYQQFNPDGVIAADDDAQTLFVVPYLKDKVSTPVMFCGVNAEPGKYGYPASNVSGILERLHIRESIALVRQLVPSVKRVAYIMKESPVADLVMQQVRDEEDTYAAKSTEFRKVTTFREALEAARELGTTNDVLFMETLEGIPDDNGKPLSDKEVMPAVAAAFGKPTIGSNAYAVRYAVLAAVVKTGQEQGITAARMLLKAMHGTPISQIPIVKNRYGKRMINVSVMKRLGIDPDPVILLGAELVK